MTNELVSEATRLMLEQAGDYVSLTDSCKDLKGALTEANPSQIQATTHAGNAVLLDMRARQVRIIQSLTAFADARTNDAHSLEPLAAETRSQFDSASKSLMSAAHDFQQSRAIAALLTTNGTTFTASCIEACGFQPTTYKGPYARTEARPWA